MSTEGTMEAWEKATMTIVPKKADYGDIGRAQGTGFNLVDLNTESMIELLRKVMECVQDMSEYEDLESVRMLIENYDKFKHKTTPRL